MYGPVTPSFECSKGYLSCHLRVCAWQSIFYGFVPSTNFILEHAVGNWNSQFILIASSSEAVLLAGLPTCLFSLMGHFHWGPMIIHRTYFRIRIKLCNYSVAFWFSLKNIHKHSLIRTIPFSLNSSASRQMWQWREEHSDHSLSASPCGSLLLLPVWPWMNCLPWRGPQFPRSIEKATVSFVGGVKIARENLETCLAVPDSDLGRPCSLSSSFLSPSRGQGETGLFNIAKTSLSLPKAESSVVFSAKLPTLSGTLLPQFCLIHLQFPRLKCLHLI